MPSFAELLDSVVAVVDDVDVAVLIDGKAPEPERFELAVAAALSSPLGDLGPDVVEDDHPVVSGVEHEDVACCVGRQFPYGMRNGSFGTSGPSKVSEPAVSVGSVVAGALVVVVESVAARATNWARWTACQMLHRRRLRREEGDSRATRMPSVHRVRLPIWIASLGGSGLSHVEARPRRGPAPRTAATGRPAVTTSRTPANHGWSITIDGFAAGSTGRSVQWNSGGQTFADLRVGAVAGGAFEVVDAEILR